MAPSPTIRRLLKETAELSASSPNPSPAFHAAPVSDADLHEWHFTLLGPPSPSPYAGGLYHGRITLPPQYPLKPPNFRFLTPSGRFEVNREICLSISGFHEETWMPAWGVRTALTALRTFMAEPGTAGQVGGLEAPEHVRKRLAAESRSWRCGGCEKTNEQVMQEWWAACREQGVKVDEEGADVGLENLPDGMAVEAREVCKDKEPSQTQSQTLQPPGSSIPPPSQSAQTSQRQPPPSSIPLSASPTPETIQRLAEARLTPSDFPSTSNPTNSSIPANPPPPSGQRPMMNLHAPPLAAAAAALEQHAALQQQQRRNDGVRTGPGVVTGEHTAAAAAQHGNGTVTIDRAIAGVFLLLVLMVLKKVFWPAAAVGGGAVGGEGWGRGAGGGAGGGEGLSGWHMEREL